MARSRKTRTPAAKGAPGRILKSACALGLGAALGILGFLVLFTFMADWNPPEGIQGGDDFSRLLADFDREFSAGGTAPEGLNRLLDRLEKRAAGVEPHLSVLKRRRNLARGAPPETAGAFKAAYLRGAERIAAAFPYSEPLAAIAADALVLRDGGWGDPPALARYLSRLSDGRFLPLTVSLSILSGKMSSPREAAALPQGDAFFSWINSLVSGREREQFLINRGILRLLGGDIQGCTAVVNTALYAPPENDPAPNTLRFAAEFFYDFGEPLRAAELFSNFPGEENLARRADALWLSGNPGAARNIWRALAAPGGDGALLPAQALRSLYNLAAATEERGEKISYLERFFTEQRQGNAGEDLSYGIIAYTRLLDGPRAIGILESQDRRDAGILDLEILRRRQEVLSIDRIVAEIWILLDRHPEDGRLYQWGAYYFDRQKRYHETAFLFRTAAFNHIDGPWMKLNNALLQIREGRLDEGELLLRSLPLQTGFWQVSANIGRILEARRSYSVALEYYEIAASLVKNKKSAALVQIRIARCLRALDRRSEIRRVLEYAASLDPENLTVRLELHRLEDG